MRTTITKLNRLMPGPASSFPNDSKGEDNARWRPGARAVVREGRSREACGACRNCRRGRAGRDSWIGDRFVREKRTGRQGPDATKACIFAETSEVASSWWKRCVDELRGDSARLDLDAGG